MVFPKKRQSQELFQPQVSVYFCKIHVLWIEVIQTHHCHQFVLFQPKTPKSGGTGYITQVSEQLNLKCITKVNNKVVQQKNGKFYSHLSLVPETLLR